MLADAVQEFGEMRQAALCRELTKRFEEVRRGTLSDLAAGLETAPVKGEVVVLVDRPHERAVSTEDMETALRARLAHMSVKDAATEVSEVLGLPRREVYQAALALDRED